MAHDTSARSYPANNIGGFPTCAKIIFPGVDLVLTVTKCATPDFPTVVNRECTAAVIITNQKPDYPVPHFEAFLQIQERTSFI